MNDAVSLEFDRRPSAIPYMVRGMMPVTRHPDLAPEICAHWRKHRPDPGALAEFRRITGLPANESTLPLLYPHTFGFRLAMAMLTHPRFPVPIWGVLQTRNHLVQHRPIAVAEPLEPPAPDLLQPEALGELEHHPLSGAMTSISSKRVLIFIQPQSS